MGCLCSNARSPRQSNVEMDWQDHMAPMTRSELRRKREVFWETRSAMGMSEVWMGLRSAAELQRDCEYDTAAAIIEALGCTPLKPSISNKALSCYDERGHEYVMPMWLFEDPRNMVDLEGLNGDSGVDQEHVVDGEEVNETISFKVRLNIGHDLQIEMKQRDTIKQLKEHISALLNGLDPTRIKIIARGKLYSDSYLLSHPFPIKNGDLIQATFPSSLYNEMVGPLDAST